MKYRYNQATNTLRQLPEMEEPDYESIKYYNEDFSHKTVKWSIDTAKYREHLSSLKSYPCSGEGWEDGKEYEEGEFEIETIDWNEIFNSEDALKMEVAVLKQKEDVWEEAIERFTQETGKEYSAMLQLTLNSQEYLFVPVPEDAKVFTIIHNGTRVAYFQPHYKRFDLPSGSWLIIGTTAEVLQSEELAKEIVEFHPNTGFFADYKNYRYLYDKATDSFQSLLQHHNIPHSIILVKQ